MEDSILLEHQLESIYKLYLNEKDIVKTSKKLYDIVLRQYVQYLKDSNIEYAKTSDILRYRNHIREKGLTINWIYIHINVIKGFYRYLRMNRKLLGLSEVYDFDVAESIKNIRAKPRISKNMLTLDQAKQIILLTKNNRKYIWHYRDHAILFLMITTGLRSIEIRRAKKKDYVHRNGQWLLYVQGKGRKEADEYVKVTTAVKEAISDYLNRRQDNHPYLFISHSKHTNQYALSRDFFPNMFKRVLKACGIENSELTPHALRHAAATFNLLRGGSLESTRQLLRHANINTTLLYAHHIERMKDNSESEIEKFILQEDSSNWLSGDVMIELV